MCYNCVDTDMVAAAGTLALCIDTTCTAPPVCGMESVGRGVSLGWKKEVDRDGRGKEKRERRGGG